MAVGQWMVVLPLERRAARGMVNKRPAALVTSIRFPRSHSRAGLLLRFDYADGQSARLRRGGGPIERWQNLAGVSRCASIGETA